MEPLPYRPTALYKTRAQWTLYWRDRNLKFHRHELIEPTADVTELFAEPSATPPASPSARKEDLTLLDDRGGVLQRGEHVFALQIRVIGEHLVDGAANGELPEHRADWDAQVTDARQAGRDRS